MDDDHDLQESRAATTRATSAGIVVAILGIFFVLAVGLYYNGWFGDTTSAPPAVSQSEPAPSGTVGQAKQNPGPAESNR